MFAAEKHSDHRRKNSAKTPYINHPIAVAEHLSSVGEVTDEEVIIAALLHDTIEDTDTTAGEIEQAFGKRVLGLVLECSDDKSLEKMERKRLQVVNASGKSPEAKMIKIADTTHNLRTILSDPPADWSQSRKLDYFDWASQVFEGLKGGNAALDKAMEQTLEEGERKFSEEG